MRAQKPKPTKSIDRKHRIERPIMTREVHQTFQLAAEDRVTYVKEINNLNAVLTVVNVSYEILLQDTWITIWRYDSSHGYLHCHMRISLTNDSETITMHHVIKKGSTKDWFTWAIRDITKNYLRYKRGFLKRSNIIVN